MVVELVKKMVATTDGSMGDEKAAKSAGMRAECLDPRPAASMVDSRVKLTAFAKDADLAVLKDILTAVQSVAHEVAMRVGWMVGKMADVRDDMSAGERDMK